MRLEDSNIAYRDPARYDHLHSGDPTHTPLVTELITTHGPTPPRTVLDLGCGTGRDLATLTPQFTGTGIDIQPGLIDYGRRTGLHHGDPHQLPDHRAPHHAGHRLVPVQQVLT